MLDRSPARIAKQGYAARTILSHTPKIHPTRHAAMRLSWNEIRARAAAFAREWHDAAYETTDTQSFYKGSSQGLFVELS